MCIESAAEALKGQVEFEREGDKLLVSPRNYNKAVELVKEKSSSPDDVKFVKSAYHITEECEIVLDGERYKLEVGDIIIVESGKRG